ncbi:PLP-dependent transferase [Cereibacter sediminicola]|uniref:PLP-dependent transferase n=1 Tax=Cereibacter sediminicola TaxID=2584941 RepID=UPI002482E734|nr:PLP-dependent transferase [Cereibacter sediminicola]
MLFTGLPGHAGHDVARRQMQNGFGGMLSIRVAGGREAAIATAAGVRVWTRATSLGGGKPDRASRQYRGADPASA